IMIINAEDQQAKLDLIVAGPTLRFPDRVAGRSSISPLPDYETSQAQHTTGLHPSIPPIAPEDDPADPPRKPFTRRRKFVRAMVYCLAIYVFFSIVLGIPLIIMVRPTFNLCIYAVFTPIATAVPPPWANTVTSSSSPSSRSGILSVDAALMCNSWQKFENSTSGMFYASASHTYPVDGSLSITSNLSDTTQHIPGISGNLTVGINSNTSVQSVVLNVDLQSSGDDLRNRTHICFNDFGANRGLTIYTPPLVLNESLSFDIQLLYPSSYTTDCANFATYLPLFAQTFQALSPGITYDTMSIYGAEANISCDSLWGRSISVDNSLASISGTFNATERLKLDTIGGPITGNVTLTNNVNIQGPTMLFLDTGNDGVNVDLTFNAPTWPSGKTPPPRFRVEARTFNGPMDIRIAFENATSSIPFELHAENNQADSTIHLDPKFSGIIDLQTKLSWVALSDGGLQLPAIDQSLPGSQRNLVVDQATATSIHGWVGTGSRPAQWTPSEGFVGVVSSLSPVYLILDP
ncbi:hypothetical protein FISHEDRAFT_51378, partial [Fistulina hepatica ATCC 64428]